MTFNFAFKWATAALSIAMISSVSQATNYKVSMNAMCYLNSKEGSKVEAFNPTKDEVKSSDSSYVRSIPTNVKESDLTEKYRIASLSKILVTHWAALKLGPNYRFKSVVHVTPAEKGACNLYFQGDGDPFLGKEMLETVFAQLKAKFKENNVCSRIETISYDENFLVPYRSYSCGKKKCASYVFQHRQDGTLRASNPTNYYGPISTKAALQTFVQQQKHLKVNSKNIGLTSSVEYADYLKKVPATSYAFKSRPLFMMMREYNAYSYNVPPDILFNRLGGEEAYAQFIKQRLGYDKSQVEVYNGSGYPVFNSSGKHYNEVSCSALVRVLQDLDSVLSSYKGGRTFQLADVMAVGGNEEEYSTFQGLYGAARYENTLTAKTGTADETITFGGMLSTTDGDLYFAALTKPSFGGGPQNNARVYIRDLLGILTDRYKVKKFDYKQIGLMIPIDGESTLVPVSTTGQEVAAAPSTELQSVPVAEVKKTEEKVTENKTEEKKAEEKKVESKKPAVTPAKKPAAPKPAPKKEAAPAKKEEVKEPVKEEKNEEKTAENPQPKRRYNVPFVEA